MNEFFLSPRMKMTDLVNERPVLLNVMIRCGIHMGFGDDSVQDCCSRQGKDAAAFLTICKFYLFDGFTPSDTEIHSLNISDITSFLRDSHESYKNEWLPRIDSMISNILKGRPKSQVDVISKFFNKFRDELRLHFELEERNFFPLLDDLERKGKGSVKVFHEEHTDIEEKIQDLANLLVGYIPYEDCDPDAAGLVYSLYSLKKDLLIHTRIEDFVILPILRGGRGPSGKEELSPREKEILVCVAKGMLNKEIAYQYNISIFTVMSHRKNISAKTGIKSIAGLTAYAILQGLIDIEEIK